MHLELKRELEEDFRKVGESKAGLEYRIDKIMCSLEGGYLS